MIQLIFKIFFFFCLASLLFRLFADFVKNQNYFDFFQEFVMLAILQVLFFDYSSVTHNVNSVTSSECHYNANFAK